MDYKLILNADFHLHTKDDPKDYDVIRYSAFELIDDLKLKGIDIFSITLHEEVYASSMMEKVRKYAKKKGLLYIPGIEQKIEGKHIVILNIKKDIIEKVHTYASLKKVKKKNPRSLVIAAHPFFPMPISCGKKVYDWNDIIDCVEYNSFYVKILNFNKKALNAASEQKKPVVGNTDAHILEQIGSTFTQIQDVQKIIDIRTKADFSKYIIKCTDDEYERLRSKMIAHIRKGNVKLKSRPYDMKTVAKVFRKLFLKI